MAWLVHGDRVLASVEIADGARSRSRGLLGREGIDGALLLQPASAIHTFRMRFPIDAAFCAATPHDDGLDLIVRNIVTMAPNRLGRPRPRSRVILEAEAGRFAQWGVAPGAELRVRMTEGSS